MRTLAVVGAAGSVGRKVCDVALDEGLEVIAVDRAFEGERRPGIEYRTADVLHDDLAGALAGAEAVVSTLGLPFTLHNATEPPPLYTRGTAAIADGMRAHAITRLAVISAAFVTPQRALPLWFAMTVVPALHAILDEMRGMERALSDSDLDWTIARPGWLLDEPAQGGLLEGDGVLPDGAFRCREGDLARFLVDAVRHDRWRRGRPALGAPDTAANESPLALGKALAAMVTAHGKA